MFPIRTIIHPTDFSERSDHALQLACSLARDYKALLVILHVVKKPLLGVEEGVVLPNPDLLSKEAEQQIARLALADASLRVRHRVEQGDPATVILSVAQQSAADLIVMGTHGRSGLDRLLMGSVAEQVVRKAICPVLTIKTPIPEAVLDQPESAPAVQLATGIA